MLRDSEGDMVARKDSGSHGHQTRGGGQGREEVGGDYVTLKKFIGL